MGEQEKRVETEKKIHDAKHGKLPDNDELTTGIDKIKTGINKDTSNLSKTGKAVTSDINNILDTTKEIIEDKNEGERLQNAYFHSQKAGTNKSYSERMAELKQLAMGDKSASREEAKKNVNSMATIVKLAILSPEFRETIDDIATITNQLLKQKSDKEDGMKDDTTKKTIHKTNLAEKQVRDDGVVEASVVESKPVTVEKVEKSKEEKRKEREDKLIDRLVDLAQTLHKKPEFRNSIEYMSNSADKLKKYTKDANEKMKEKKEKDKSKENTNSKEHHKKEARVHAKAFLENWIGDDYSLDKLLRQINYLYEKSKTDEELRALLSDWKKWSTTTVKDSDYVEDREQVRSDVKDLIHRTREMNSRYKEEVHIIRREVDYINKSIQRDDSIITLRDHFSQLGRDLMKDSHGNPTIKPELLGDAQIIIGSILEAVRHIPLPPIKRMSEDMDLELENIVLDTTDITPSNIRFIVQADGDKDKEGSRQADNSFLIEIKKVRARLSSVNFYVNKKTGFPKINDRGLADIDLTRNGLGLTIEVAPKMERSGNDFSSLFEAKNVTCTVDKLKIHLRETSHDTLYKILSPIINKTAKKRMETGIANYIKENMNKMNTISSEKATKTKTKADKKVEEKKQHD